MRGPKEATPLSSVAPLSYPEEQRFSKHFSLQPPLSRRGKGPGLILVLDHYALLEASEKHLDPPPLKKWAEEGFAVVQLLLPGKPEDGGEFPLQRALDLLKDCEGCEFGNGVGLISYISRLPYYVEEAVCLTPDIKALVSYGGRKVTTLNETTASIPPQLIHMAGPDMPRCESISIAPDMPARASPSSIVKVYRYDDAKRESGWMLPSDEEYHKRSAGLAHTRTLSFLKPLLNGPYFDLETIWDEHCAYEFAERDVDKTMATMVDQPYVNHIPTMTGGIGQAPLKSFYKSHFIFSNPPDTSLSLISRTVGIDRVIDEFIFSLTHTTEIPWFLPGLPPTGKKVEVPFTSVVAMRGDRLCHEHISWDQGTVLKQLRLLPETVRLTCEVEGEEGMEGKKGEVTFEVKLPVVGAEGSAKLRDEGSVESNMLMGNQWRVLEDA